MILTTFDFSASMYFAARNVLVLLAEPVKGGNWGEKSGYKNRDRGTIDVVITAHTAAKGKDTARGTVASKKRNKDKVARQKQMARG